jgi:hypothetical protein
MPLTYTYIYDLYDAFYTFPPILLLRLVPTANYLPMELSLHHMVRALSHIRASRSIVPLSNQRASPHQ